MLFIGGAPVLNNTIKRATQKQNKSAYFEKTFVVRWPCISRSKFSRSDGVEWVGVESWSGMEWSGS